MQAAVENALKQYIEISGRDVKTIVDASLSDDSYVPINITPHSLSKHLKLTHIMLYLVLEELK